MYADRIQTVLDDKDISPGTTVTVTTGDDAYTGILMPRAEQGDNETLVIKLDNGYNIGITYTEETSIERDDTAERASSTEVNLPEPDPEKTDIAVLHTGGTIASRVSYGAGGVEPALDPEDLYEIYPELFDRANVDTHVVAKMYSGDMEPAHWQQIAEAVADHRDKDGVIIGHGTDTMQYTAAALSFMLEDIDIPVVLVGSQRSSDRPSSDAAVNLLSAAAFIDEDIPGVYVCMHDSMDDDGAAIHRGTRVRKMHTSRRDTFRSIDTDPVARVSYPNGDVTVNADAVDAAPDGEFRLRTELDEQVGLLKSVPGLDPEIFDHYDDYSGLVLSGTGLGHFPVNSFDDHTEHHDETLDRIDALADEKPVVMTSQCLHGRVNMNIYQYGVKLREAGVVSAETMLPEVAYVKLMWALGQTDSVDAAEDLFTTNIAGELIPREEHDGFR